MTPLMWIASRQRGLDILRELMDDGHAIRPDLNLKNNVGVRTLADYVLYSTVDFLNQEGDTALHIAARRGYSSMVKYLFTAGANPHILNKVQVTSNVF